MPRLALTRTELDTLRDRIAADLADAIENAPLCSVHVSGGNGSAANLFLCQELFGRERVSAVFADTRSEDPDLYRFLEDVERVSGVEIVRLDQGKNIWDVFDEEGIMRIARKNACKASIKLKREPLDAYSASLGPHVTAIGFDWLEPERIAGLMEQKDGLIFPLAVHRLTECDFRKMLTDRGIEPSSLYGEGFIHNNCGGGCILAGLAQWAHHYKTHPERYAEDEAREKAFYERTGFTVLRDQSGGTVKSYTLTQLREDVDAGKTFKPMKTPVCGCMFD